MTATLYTARAATAVTISFGMAVLACLTACLPTAEFSWHGDSGSEHSRVSQASKMECCHDSDESPSTPSNGDQRHSPQTARCCPPEATMVQKHAASLLTIASCPSIAGSQFMGRRLSQTLVGPQLIWHSGRDTLLETQLLRI
jgi:hypothetical protein